VLDMKRVSAYAIRAALVVCGMALLAGCDDSVSDIVFGSLQLAFGIVDAAS